MSILLQICLGAIAICIGIVIGDIFIALFGLIDNLEKLENYIKANK